LKVAAVSTALPSQPTTRRTSYAKESAGATLPPLDLKRGVTKEYLQAALTTRIGKAIEETLQANGLSLDDTVGVDWSADATSDRIVAGTTSLLGIFARQNPNLSRSELVAEFEKTIRGGIAKGYQEALSILEAMSAFDDSVRGLGQETMRLVDKKLDDYFAKLRESIQADPASSGSGPAHAQAPDARVAAGR